MNMNNIEAWTWIVAFFTPYVVAFINRPEWTQKTQRILMVVVAVVIALVAAAINGDFNGWQWGNGLTYLVAFIGAVQTSYSALKAFRPTAVTLDKATVAFSKSKSPAAARAAKESAAQKTVDEFTQNVAGSKAA